MTIDELTLHERFRGLQRQPQCWAIFIYKGYHRYGPTTGPEEIELIVADTRDQAIANAADYLNQQVLNPWL